MHLLTKKQDCALQHKYDIYDQNSPMFLTIPSLKKKSLLVLFTCFLYWAGSLHGINQCNSFLLTECFQLIII